MRTILSLMMVMLFSVASFAQENFKFNDNSNVERQVVTSVDKSGKAIVEIFSEDFEGYETGADLNGEVWTTYDQDGDGNNWFAFTTETATNVATSASWIPDGALTPENWLVSPAIDLTEYTADIALDWTVFGQDPEWALEHYKVVVSTTDNAVESFTDENIVLEETLPGNEIYERNVDLTAYAGEIIYIAFVHYNISDMFRINLDNILVSADDGEVGVSTNQFDNLTAYPNPFTNEITVNDASKIERVVVYNLIGQEVMNVKMINSTVNTSDLSSGVYVVTFVGSNGERAVRKMIKQ